MSSVFLVLKEFIQKQTHYVCGLGTIISDNIFKKFIYADTLFNSFTTKMQTTQFSSASFKINGKSKQYHNENSKTRVQTV